MNASTTTARNRVASWDVDYGLAIAKALGVAVLAGAVWVLWAASSTHVPAGYHLPGWHTTAAVIGTVALVGLTVSVVFCEFIFDVAKYVFFGLVVATMIPMSIYTGTTHIATFCNDLPC